jgi:hypothetical protein
MRIFKKQLVTWFGVSALTLMVTLVSAGRAHAQDPGVTAYQDEQSDLKSSKKVRDFTFNIPTGKRMIIDRVSAEISVPHGKPIRLIDVSTYLNGAPNASAHFLPRPTLAFTRGKEDVYVLFVAPNVAAEIKVIFTIETPTPVVNNVKTNIFVTISGHLVCPQHPTCALAGSPGSLSGVSDRALMTATIPTNADAAAQSRPRFAKPPKRETVALKNRQ